MNNYDEEFINAVESICTALEEISMSFPDPEKIENITKEINEGSERIAEEIKDGSERIADALNAIATAIRSS